MNFHQSIFQNNNLKIIKYLALITLIFLLSFKANTEIPEKYKIESELPKCKGANYTKWTNCYGEYKFPRIEYKGEWIDGNFHGKGILKEAWGDIFVGDFVKNKAEGYGKQTMIHNGEVEGYFEGELKNDLLNGKGVWVNEHGKFEGNFKDHLLDGFAKAEYSSGTKYEGYWKKDFYHGQGTINYADGSKYVGEFKEGSKHGSGIMEYAGGDKFIGVYEEEYLKKGEYIYANGSKFIGEWNEHEKKSGKGKMIWNDGTVYIGDYKEDFMTGKGELIDVNGTKYVGEFFEDLYHGKGTMEYYNGNKYVGSYINGVEDGYGVYEWADGEKYEGEWKSGKKEGKGKYTYESGTIYEGDFLNNYAQGKGKFIYSDGAKYEGEIKEGYENGQGEMLYPNGDIYVGQWKNGYPHGQGKIVYANGNIYEGLFEDGKEAEGKTTLAKFTTNEKYYALIIGNNDYDELIKLDNAVNDAVDLDKVLREKYGFETILMLDKKADEIEKAIIEFTDNRKRNDNILIYYAGHGKLIKKQKLERGYWLPKDAGPKRDPNWISNNDIKDSIASSNAKHILLIVDSCFSGSLMRGSGENKLVEKLTSKNLDRLKSKTTRLVITSGGNEDVADGIGEAKNSVFAEPLIDVLKNNTDVIKSYELFNEVRTYVINNSDQTPNHALIHGTGHDGGEFLFFPKS